MKKKVHIMLLMFMLTLFAGKIAVSAATGGIDYSINFKTAKVNIGDVDNRLELKLVKPGTDEIWGGVTRWTSSNVNVATVEQEGKTGIVTPLRKGTAVISSGVGFPRETCVVTVVEPSVKLNKTTANLYVGPEEDGTRAGGTSVKVKATVKGADAKKVEWSSSNSDIASVEVVPVRDSEDRRTGEITAKKPGTAIITAKANGKTAVCKVTVTENSLSLNVNNVLVSHKGIGSSVKVVPTVIGPNKKVTWESENKNVAMVSGGKITGKATGITTIIATANGVSARCNVEVKEGLLSINEEHVLLYVTGGAGETKQLKTNAAKTEKVTWSSSDEAVAKVDNNGKVTAAGAGIAKISVVRLTNGESGADGNANGNADSCIVEVKDTSSKIKEDSVVLTTKGNAKTYQLSYETVGRKAAKWTSSNNKVVSVSKGKLTAKKEGAAVITLDVNGVKDTVNISVQAYTPAIKLNQSEYTIYTAGSGKTVTLKATVDGPSKKVTWKSGNTSIATVKNGKVTAVGEGRTLITAMANGKTSKCWISVREPKVTLDKTALILKVDETAELPADVVGASQTVKYVSSNTKVAAVSKGKITAKKVGDADIKVTANGVTAVCHVKVSACEEHVFGESEVVRPAGCEEGGITARTCSVCGGTEQVSTDPTGHSYGKWTVAVKATENASGLEVQRCIVCGAENTRVISAKSKGDSVHSYKLVWEDDFDGDSLNTENWNYEYHDPGWVNAELQAYVDSPENIYVKDGYLTIQAIKHGEGDQATYTSGRINTQNKQDYQYGRFEVRAKVPSGKGFLPAFWMMPTDESYYGQWPKCGEIDVMEVHGSALNTSYSTLHFGEPHTQKQGTYTLPKGAKNFGEDFHVYACEWDPDEFRFYVDGQMFYKVNDWFTKREGFGEVAYPAPYDQPFYMILNLAVGGSWVGYPDEDTLFEDNAQLVVDYVKVYQKDEYDYDIDKPETEVELRDPDSTGNYIINGDFAKVEDLKKGDKNWQLLLTEGGDATAAISGKELHITTKEAGSVNYSVQVVQANLPIEQGSRYKLSYEAYADENRTMITGLTAPDRGYIRYLTDTTVNLTQEKQKFEHTFEMTSNSDANGRVEFNLGNQGSTTEVHITNVRLEKDGDAEEEAKSVLPDGNYVYNGQFNEGNAAGKLRLAYWDWDALSGTSVSVTNDAKRELKVVVPDTAAKLEDVVVSQDPIAIKGGKQYVLSFTARADGDKTIQTTVAGETFASSLTKESTEYRYEIDATEKTDLNGTALQFLLGTPGTIWIDDVSIRENGMIVNGDFSNGLVGFELFVDASASASAMVDELNEDKAVCIDINDTGDQDWKIQLKQNNVKLEEGKWYNISFDAKSTMDRAIMYALQRDGTSDDVWTPYSGTQKINLTSKYQNFSTTFKMASATDPATILSISMGAVNGTVIKEKHTVTIDNIKLVETEPQEEEEPTPGTNMIKNGDFSEGDANWENSAGTRAAVTFDGKAVYDIKDVGANDYDVQLKQTGLKLEQGASYNVKFKISSTAARTVKYGFLDPTNGYKWYGGEDLSLEAGVTKEVNHDFTVDDPACVTSSTIEFYISMGKIEGVDTPISKIEIDDIELYKTGEGSGDQPGGDDPAEGEEIITDGNFSEGDKYWDAAITSPAEATATFTDNKATFNIANAGGENWHIQLKQSGLTVESGEKYRIRFTVKSSAARSVEYSLMSRPGADDQAYYGGTTVDLEANQEQSVDKTITASGATREDAQFIISLGKVGGDTPGSIVEISEVSVMKLDSTPDDDEEIPVGKELIKNGDFSDGKDNWTETIQSPGDAASSYENNKAAFEITNVGTEDWHVQLKQEGLKLENGESYTLKFDISSTKSRKVLFGLMNAAYVQYFQETLDLAEGETESVERTFKVSYDTDRNISFYISMGMINKEETAASTIEISNVSLMKVEAVEEEPIEPEKPGTDLIKNGDFSEGETNWEKGIYGGSDGKMPEADVTFSSGDEGKVTYNITNVGDSDWNIQLIQKGLTLEQGVSYKVQFKIKSSAARSVKYAFMTSGDDWYGGETIALEEGVEKQIDKTITIDKDTSSDISFKLSMGQMKYEDGDLKGQDIDTPISTIEIDDISVVKLGEEDKTEEADTLQTFDKPIKEEEPETDENISDESEDGDDADDTSQEDADEDQTEEDSKAEDETDDAKDAEPGDNTGDEDTSGGEDVSVEEGISFEVETDTTEQQISFID